MGCNTSNSVHVAETSASLEEVKAENRPVSSKNNQPLYKLTYFDITGRAELIRMIFAVGNLNFEDHRIKTEQWPELKKQMPLGQVPVLEIAESPILVQTLAIARYVAKDVGIAGRNSLEMAKVDAVLDTAKELFDEFVKKIVPETRNPTDQREKVFQDFLENIVPNSFKRIETLITLYGSEDYCVGDQLTVADLYIHDIVTNLIKLNPFVLANYPLLKKNRTKVETNDNLKSYLQRRK
nr:glutathione S-transferase GSTS14 [Brachionus angularis]